ncbi:hypothetical protein AMK59_545, partial [Oryctes borbonicus]
TVAEIMWKYITAVLFLSTSVISLDGILMRLIEQKDICIKELNLNETEINTLKIKSLQGMELSHREQCVVACMLQRAGFVENGKLNSDVLKKSIPDDISLDLGKCEELTGSDDCETSLKI